jgi:hypothetical protein
MPFNPDLTANAPCIVTYQISGPGMISSRVLFEYREIWSTPPGPRSETFQELIWDGKDSQGTKVKDGSYTLQVTFVDTETRRVFNQDIPVTVSRIPSVVGVLIHTGRTGSGAAKSAQILPQRTLEMGVGFAPVGYIPNGTSRPTASPFLFSVIFPINVDLAYSASPNFEYAGSVQFSPVKDYFDDNRPFGLAVSVKYVNQREWSEGGTLQYGVNIHGDYSTWSTQFPETPRGLGAGLLVGYGRNLAQRAAWSTNLSLDYTLSVFPIQRAEEVGEVSSITDDLPTWISAAVLFKYQEASFSRSFWLTYRLITIADSSVFPAVSTVVSPLHSIGGGIEYLRHIGKTNLAVSISAEVTFFQVATSPRGTLGVWYFFPGGR